MAQSVWGNPALDACRGGRSGEGIRQYAPVDRCVAAVVGEQPAAIVMAPPQVAQRIENRLWQRHEPLLVALADDTQHLVSPVDGTNFQRGGFADAQATGIHDGEAGLVGRVADTAE